MNISCMQIGSSHLQKESSGGLGCMIVLGCLLLSTGWGLGWYVVHRRQVRGKKLLVWSALLGVVSMAYIIYIPWPSQHQNDFPLGCDKVRQLNRITDVGGDATWAEVYLTHWKNQLLVAKIKRRKPRQRPSGTQIVDLNTSHRPGCSPEAHIRNEGEISGLFIGNPYVAQRVGYCESIPAIIYEYYPSTLLEMLFNPEICAGSDWSLGLIIGLSLGVARSVEALHEARWGPVVHAEINPGQFLIDETGAVRIADFHHSTHPVVGQVNKCKLRVGGRYIAPEQVQDKDITPATDIYALGLVIWTIANREYAFDGISKQEVWTLVVEGKRPTIATNLPKALIDIIEACWEQNPEDRPNITFVRMELEKLEKTVENPNSSAMNRMQVTL